MGTIQVPGRISGKTYTIGIKGDTPSETEQARIRAFLEERESQFAADYEARYGAPLAVEDGTALGRGWEVGKAGAYSRLGTATEYLGRGLGLESLTGVGQRMREEGDYEAFLESLRQPKPTTLQDVTGIGSALTYLGEGIGQSGPEMLAPLAATGIGTLAGTAATGNPFTGGAIGLGAGAVTAFPSFFGGNIQRQEAEVAAGRKDEVDVTNAIVGAVGQSALNSIGDKLLLGGFLKPGQKWLTRTAVGAAEGAAVEIPTEIAQQIIERKQAGLPLDNDEAINEYINAGILGGVMGGGIRGATAGLGIGIERPAAPPSANPPGTPPVRPPLPTLGVGQEQGELFGDLPEQTAPGATVGAETDQQATAAPSTERQLEMFAPEAGVAPDQRIGAGTTIDEDLAAARKIYDDAVAFALDLGTDPEKAKELAAQQTVNYVDSLQEETRKRLERFRNTMARVASPTAAPAPAPSSKSVRGVMPPDLPDSAYAPEFGETVQKDLFAPSPAAPAPAAPAAPAAPKANTPVAPVAEPTTAPAATPPAAPKLKPIPFDQYARKPNSQELIPRTNVRGEAPIIDLGGRKIVLRDVNGVQVPFYLSSGLAGKKDVAAGKWYPILGIGPDGWINKGTQQEINDYYGSPELRAAAEELDATIGDIRNDTSVPKVKPSGAHMDAINAGLNPAANEEADTQERFNANLADLLARIRAGAPTVETRPAAPKAPTARTSKKYTVSTEDAGDFEVRVTRLPDGSATVFTPDSTQDYPAEFAASKSDEDLMAYQLEPLRYKGVKDDTTTAAPQPEPMGVSVEDGGRGVEQRKFDADVQPAEGVETPAEGGLGGDLSVPMGADTAARAEPDTLSQLEEQLAAARARAAELRKKVPAGVLQREFTGGEVDPALVKRVENLQNNLNRQQIAADKARDAVPKKPTHPARPKKLAQYEEALAKVKETQEQLAVAQDALGTAELAANLRRGAQPKTQLQGKAKSAYTAYFNALQDADTLRKTLESERARSVVAPEQRPALPTDLKEPVIPDTFMTYQRGITSKPVRPSAAPKAVADEVAKERVTQRLTQFFQQRATPALLRYTTAQGGINSPTTWKYYPDWMSLADQSKVVQLLGRLNRKEREKYKFPASEVEPLSPEAEAAHTYFSKTIRPVDAIAMMLDDLSADYAIYEGSLRPGLTEIEHRDLMMGTGSEVAKRALNWVRANLSPETNTELDLSLKKQAEKNAVTADWIGAEGTDRVAGGRAARDAARKAARSAAEKSGYDAGSIVRKMAAGDSRVALDQEMHYSVKAALNVGDLKGALRALAATTSNPELKDLANRFAGLVGTTRVRVLYPGDSAKYIGNDRGVYVQQPAGVDPDYENIILINGQTGMTNHVLMHEMAHAVSAKFTTANPNHPVVRQLEALLNELRSRGPKRDWYTDGRVKAFTYPNDFYGLTSVSEMVAEGYGRLALGETDNGLRDLMKRTTLPVELKVEFENPLTAWERFKEIIANILNAAMRKPLTRSPRTKRTETIQGYESAEARFHRLVDGLLSEAPQVLPDSVLQNAVVNPMVGRNVLNNAVLGAPVWTPAGMSRLGQLMMTAVPKGLKTALLGLLQLEWFNDLAGKYYSEIGKLQTVDELRRGKIERANDSAKPVIEDNLAYAKKSPEMYALATSVYGQATMLGVDPTAPQSKYAADKEKLAEWHNLNRQLDQDRSGEARRLFSKTKALKESVREEIKRVLKGRALDITGDETKANNLVAQLLKKLDDENAIDPYFALMREGDYWMSYTAEDTTAAPVAVGPLGQMKRPTTRYVQAFESPFDRAAARAKLEAAKDANGDRVAWDFKETMNPISEAPKGGQAPTALVQGALNIISGFGGQGATDAEKARVQAATEAIQELFVRLSPGHSLMKSMLKRKGTRGFLGDIGPIGVIGEPVEYVDALATKVNSLAYQLANIEFGGQIQKLMNSALETRNKLQDSESLTSAEKAAADAYYDEFQMRAQFAKSPQVSKAAQVTRGVTFGWTLGGLLAGGLNNLAQLPMIAVPELAGRYSLPGTMRELGFAMRALANAGKTQRVLSYGVDGREARTLDSMDNFGSIANFFEPNADGTLSLRTDINIPAELRDKIANLDVLADEMSKHGMLSASMTREMLESETNWLHKINRWGGFFMHQAERFNRQTVAVTAYNLELGKLNGPATPEAKRLAAKKAMEITGKVNGAIGASTAPRWAMGAVGSVVFMFKRFGLQMARYIINATLASLKRIDPNMSEADIAEAKKERAVARYQLTGVLGATALLAGVQGLPFFSEVMSLINLFFTDDDEERAEVLVQKFLGEPYYHGALNYLLGIEVASRISLSGLIFRENKIEKDQSVYYDLIEMFGGPAVGVALNFERGWNLIGEGEVYRGLEAMSPAAVKALMKAGRFGTDGATTLRGDEIVPLTPIDIVRQGLGYTPGVYARQQERVSGAKRIDEAVREKKRKLLQKFNVAYREGDFVTVREVLKEMREFGRKYPEEQILPETIEKSRRSFEQRSQEMISGVSFTNSGRTRADKSFEEFDEDVTLWASLAN
jgi:hypothetical protein